MKICLLCIALATGVLQMASADTICASPVSVTAGGSSPTFSCDGVTFSNFVLSGVTGGATGRLDILSVTVSSTGNIVLSENPNLGAAQHENLWFTVSGSLSSVDLSVGGTAATVTERVCQNPIPMGGALNGLCTDASGTTNMTPLANLTVHSGDLGQPVTVAVPRMTTYYVYKDIATGTGGGLSDMNESFHAASTVPEPASMLLLGSGLMLVSLGSKFARRAPR